MSDLNRIRLLLADPFLTQSDVELFERQTEPIAADDLSSECPQQNNQAPSILFELFMSKPYGVSSIDEVLQESPIPRLSPIGNPSS